jgi:Ufm1-specific protease 1
MAKKELIDLEEIENHLKVPNEINEKANLLLARGPYKYYHYGCDNFNDVGWGCGYRTIQTICSWIQNQLRLIQGFETTIPEVPSILEIQKILTESGDKPASFEGSKQWIGTHFWLL